MKLNLLLIIIVLSYPSFSQTKYYEEYVKSFPKTTKGDIIKFPINFQKQKLMNREEALKFVYNGDTAKLICVREEHNMMTEKFIGISKEERMPEKCMFLDMGDFFLICHTSYDCHDKQKPQISYTTLTTVNRVYKLVDTLKVYKGINDMDALLGEINTNNGAILLVGDLKNESAQHTAQFGLKTIDAKLLTIDKVSLKFKVLKESSGIKGDYYNFSKVLKDLGWENAFMMP